MPAIADPYRARPLDAPSDTFRDPALNRRSHSLRVRVRTALQRAELTRALAEGADPSTRPSLRCARRSSPASAAAGRSRAAMRRTIAEAHKPAMTRSRVVIIRRGAVLDAEGAIDAMIERLGSSQPVRAEGMAIAERILTNADRSPLYNSSEPGALRRLDRCCHRGHGPRALAITRASDRGITPQPPPTTHRRAGELRPPARRRWATRATSSSCPWPPTAEIR